MLEHEEDIKFDLLDRYIARDILNEEVFKDTSAEIAFVLEDEIRTSARHHFIDSSMWGDIVLPYIEKADYKEIASLWLSKARNSREKSQQNNKTGKQHA